MRCVHFVWPCQRKNTVQFSYRSEVEYSDETDDWKPGSDDSDLTFDDSDWFPNSDLEIDFPAETEVSVD